MTRGTPVWQRYTPSDSYSDDDSDDDVGYSSSKNYITYTLETFHRWFCRCCGKGKSGKGKSGKTNKLNSLLIILIISYIT
eukprot:CAMPEP_0118646132 /NCGR_PEP_ID=MMETSP0785-20121206/7885_1 /TAXON_ID=91992 /ORGANISM="Bolidomonas pacifica, Strain CCMP 1866" /LENGTH=79 /DNA_ID=CAMNT_0006538089 /DNA_START=820 /DNA_END=1055 /DNA_ORIENTATION=-